MKDSLKVLLVTHNYPRFPGDYAGVFLGLLARRLLDCDIQPIVLAPHHEGAAEYEENSGVKIYRFRYADDVKDQDLAYHGAMQTVVMGSIKGALKFRRFLNSFEKSAKAILKQEKIDVIAGQWLFPAGVIMKRLERRFNGPMILSSHGTDVRIMGKLHGIPFRYLRGMCRRLCRWTVVSSWMRNQVLLHDPSLDERVEVLPLPHDDTLFYPDETVKRDPLRVVSVTRYTEQKRVVHLVKAFAEVTTKLPKAQLDIYGTGPMKADVEREIAAHGLMSNVRLLEPVAQEELRRVYSEAAVSVLNSYREGFGLALSEAMLCGAAAVGTRSGGIIDIIEHQKRGLLVEVDSVSGLSNALVSLLTDADYRSRISQAGLEYASKTFAAGPLAARYADILRSCHANYRSSKG